MLWLYLMLLFVPMSINSSPAPTILPGPEVTSDDCKPVRPRVRTEATPAQTMLPGPDVFSDDVRPVFPRGRKP